MMAPILVGLIAVIIVTTSFSAVGLCSSSDRAFTKSVVAQPRPPNSRTVSRKGRLVYPASGDRNRFDESGCGPIRMCAEQCQERGRGQAVAETDRWLVGEISCKTIAKTTSSAFL